LADDNLFGGLMVNVKVMQKTPVGVVCITFNLQISDQLSIMVTPFPYAMVA